MIQVLRQTREQLRAAYWILPTQKEVAQQIAWQVVFAQIIAENLIKLDSYLTGSTECRNFEGDMKVLLSVLEGKGQPFRLSDGLSEIWLNLPNPKEPETVWFLGGSDSDKVKYQWLAINTPEAQPIEFGVPDENGREQ